MTWDPIKQQDVPDNNDDGLLEKSTINRMLFILVAISLVFSVVMVILAIWDYVGRDVAWKTVATCGTIIGGGVLFSKINDYFGERERK